jgi:hypothetical protein
MLRIDGCNSSRAAGGSAIEKVLFSPFRPRTTHVMLFRVVFSDRPVPGRTEKCHQRAEGAAENGNENGCSEPNLSHVILHAKK